MVPPEPTAPVRLRTMLCSVLFVACVGARPNDRRPASPDAGVTPTCPLDLEPQLARLGVPGLSVGIVRKGRLVCTGVAGWADLDEKRRVTPDTAFAWASISKTVTAVTVMTPTPNVVPIGGPLGGHVGVIGVVGNGVPQAGGLDLQVDNDPHLNWVKIFWFQFDAFEGTGDITREIEQDLTKYGRAIVEA